MRLEQGDGERVREVLVAAEDLAVVAAVVGGRVDGVGPSVDPVHPLGGQIEGEAVGPSSVPVGGHHEDNLPGVWIARHVT